jgi:hypothetical protein
VKESDGCRGAGLHAIVDLNNKSLNILTKVQSTAKVHAQLVFRCLTLNEATSVVSTDHAGSSCVITR